jgi:hypothetical protein
LWEFLDHCQLKIFSPGFACLWNPSLFRRFLNVGNREAVNPLGHTSGHIFKVPFALKAARSAPQTLFDHWTFA